MPLYTGTTIQEVGRKAPNTIKGEKKGENKERYDSQNCIPKCKKEAVNSREALYNSG